MRIIVTTIVLFIVSIEQEFLVNGLTCYECRSDSNAERCVTDLGTRRECDKKYCTIYRREYLDPAGKIENFYRSCEDAPRYLNTVVETSDHRAYYRSCDNDLCNKGDGLTTVKAVLLSTNSSITEIYVVPGTGSTGNGGFALLNDFALAVATSLVLALR